MPLALLYLLLPAALAYVALDRTGLLRSLLARVFTAWFIGMFAATTAVYAVATVLAPWSGGVLRKSALVVLVFSAAGLVFVRRRAMASVAAAFSGPLRRAGAVRLLFLAACAAFAFLFYRPHLAQTPTAIFRSPVYWDLNVHVPIVQNFAFGDNFPAQNESFAGAPETYHFFFDLLTAVPVSFGMDLSSAFLLVSAVSLLAVLGLLAGFAEEMLGGAAAGMLAALFACTSSSLRFLDFFRPRPGRALAGILAAAAENRQHPYLFSFVAGNPFAYNGTMFNLFYFLAERQLVFASGFLLAAVLLLQTRERWSLPACVAAGLALGGFCFWHLFVTISLGAALAWLLVTSRQRRRTAAILAGMAVVGIGFLLWTHSVTRPEWFRPDARPALRFDPAFTTILRGPAFSPGRALGYWVYAWGLKLPVAAAGLLLAFRARRRAFDALACVVVPTFLLVNAVRLWPLSVFDNHKWLRPMNLFVDLAAAYFLIELVRGRRWRAARLSAFAAAAILLTLSGALELVPFLRSRPTVLYASYPTPLTDAIRSTAAPRSVFVSPEAKAVHLAGRKLFIGNDADERGARSLIASAGFDIARRRRLVDELHAAATRTGFCALARENGVDWFQTEPGTLRPSGADATAPGFTSVSPRGDRVRFLDVDAFCGQGSRRELKTKN